MSFEAIGLEKYRFQLTIAGIAVLAFISLIVASAPLTSASASEGSSMEKNPEIDNIPYTWQEIDGLCAYASFSSVLQYYGENLSLEKTLALSGASWGAARVKAGTTWLFLTNPLSIQMWDFDYLADSLGYKLRLYYSEKEIRSGSAQKVEGVAKRLDFETQTLDNWPDAKVLLESKLENEIPTILSVDAYYLPHNQYLTLPRGTLLLPRHGVVAVGHSENGVEIMDPAIGVLGKNYGRPSRSQATYDVGFSRLRKGWKNTGFTAFSLEKVGKGEDITKSLVSRIRNKISPPDNITGIYPQTLSEQPTGYRAFAALSRDFAPENFLSLLKSWNTRFHENRAKVVETLQGARSSLVKAMTLTKYSLSKGTKGLKKSSENYEKVVEEFNRAVEDFGNISDNYRLLYPVKDKRSDNTALDLAFDTLSDKLRENASLESAIGSARPYLENLSRIFEDISSHLRKGSEILKVPEESEKRGAHFSMKNLSIGKKTLKPGESTTVSVDVKNTGGAEGSKTVKLRIEGEMTDRETVTLSPGESRTVEFPISKEKEGTYEVTVGEMSKSFEVKKAVVAKLKLRSGAFKEGENIPVRYTADGKNISPPITIENVPDQAKSLALVVVDLDAPGGNFTHWVMWNMPADIGTIPEDVQKEKVVRKLGGAKQGKNGFGEIGYGGPSPPEGSSHRYRFTLYALDKELELSAGATKGQLMDRLEGHTLQKSELVGVYKRAKGGGEGLPWALIGGIIVAVITISAFALYKRK